MSRGFQAGLKMENNADDKIIYEEIQTYDQQNELNDPFEQWSSWCDE